MVPTNMVIGLQTSTSYCHHLHRLRSTDSETTQTSFLSSNHNSFPPSPCKTRTIQLKDRPVQKPSQFKSNPRLLHLRISNCVILIPARRCNRTSVGSRLKTIHWISLPLPPLILDPSHWMASPAVRSSQKPVTLTTCNTSQSLDMPGQWTAEKHHNK